MTTRFIRRRMQLTRFPRGRILPCSATVIDMGEYHHEWSRRLLLGDAPSDAEIAFYSPQLHVTADTPPAFLWHTAQDATVPAINSMLYAAALQKMRRAV